MASFDLTVEDSSPLILYSPAGAWSDATDDPLLSSYSGSSFHSTSTQGATATINFNGTGISIFGGKRSNYGTYSITVDGQTVASGSATSQQETFKQLLGSASSLANGPHTVILTNMGDSSLDIDFVDIQSQAGNVGSQVTMTTIDDNDARMTYQPPEAWHANTSDMFMSSSLHFTNDSSATASLSFSGDAVAIWGTVSPDHANIRVTLDGQTHTFNAGSGGAVSLLHAQTLLFFANDLGSAQHSLVIAPDQQPNTGMFVDIDAVQVFATRSDASSSSDGLPSSAPSLAGPAALPSATSSSDKVEPHRKMAVSTIASIVVGVLLGLFVLGAVFFLLWRRRRRRQPVPPLNVVNEKPASPKTPDLPIQLEGGFRTPSDQLPALPEPSLYERDRYPGFPPPRSRESTFTISSYYTESSTTSSTAPMLSRNAADVPIIRAPRPPRQLTPNSRPARPSQRPPTLELPS